MGAPPYFDQSGEGEGARHQSAKVDWEVIHLQINCTETTIQHTTGRKCDLEMLVLQSYEEVDCLGPVLELSPPLAVASLISVSKSMQGGKHTRSGSVRSTNVSYDNL